MISNAPSQNPDESGKKVSFPMPLLNEIVEFSGTTLVSNLLPMVEQLIQLEEYITESVRDGSTFTETDANNEKHIVDFSFQDAAVNLDGGELQVRMPVDIHDRIIARSGKETFSQALPYLQSALNMAKLIRAESEKGSKYVMTSACGAEKHVNLAV